MPTPTWQAVTSGQAPLAAHINQFLGVHGFSVLYAATQKSGQTTLAAGTSTTATTYLAQSFTTAVGQTAIGYVSAPISSNTPSGANLATTTLSLYASSGTAPTGSALGSVTLTTEYAYLATGNGVSTNSAVYPLPVSGLTASTSYWLVLKIAGNATNHYVWNQSNQTSGASTSPDGVTWTAQAFGFGYQVFDQTVSGKVTATWEEGGNRWTSLIYKGSGGVLVTYMGEYTAGSTSSSYAQSVRLINYTNGFFRGAV